MVLFRGPPTDMFPAEQDGLGVPYHPLTEPRARMFSPSSREIIVDNNLNWEHRDFFPSPFRLDYVQTKTRPSLVTPYAIPTRPATFGPPTTNIWPDPAIPQPTAIFRLPTGVSVNCQYDAYIKDFPHAYSRRSFHPTDKAKQKSGAKYYIVFYGHEVGIFKLWGGLLGTDLQLPWDQIYGSKSLRNGYISIMGLGCVPIHGRSSTYLSSERHIASCLPSPGHDTLIQLK
jgi:hypothetical protein